MAHNVHHNLHHSPHAHTHSVTGKPTRRDFISSLVSAAVLAPWALGQTQTQSASDTAERFRQMSEEYESKGLATPFKGITTNGEVVPGLFAIRPSGVSTEPVRNAAEAFIATLTPLQLARTMYPVDALPIGNRILYVHSGAMQRTFNMDVPFVLVQPISISAYVLTYSIKPRRAAWMKSV
jgi:hypothetical protein